MERVVNTFMFDIFVVDKIRNKEVKIVYCPTEKMIADYSSKSTQGKLFDFQRKTIQGIKVEDYKMDKKWYKKSWSNIDYSMTSSMIYFRHNHRSMLKKNSHQIN